MNVPVVARCDGHELPRAYHRWGCNHVTVLCDEGLGDNQPPSVLVQCPGMPDVSSPMPDVSAACAALDRLCLTDRANARLWFLAVGGRHNNADACPPPAAEPHTDAGRTRVTEVLLTDPPVLLSPPAGITYVEIVCVMCICVGPVVRVLLFLNPFVGLDAAWDTASGVVECAVVDASRSPPSTPPPPAIDAATREALAVWSRQRRVRWFPDVDDANGPVDDHDDVVDLRYCIAGGGGTIGAAHAEKKTTHKRHPRMVRCRR